MVILKTVIYNYYNRITLDRNKIYMNYLITHKMFVLKIIYIEDIAKLNYIKIHQICPFKLFKTD